MLRFIENWVKYCDNIPFGSPNGKNETVFGIHSVFNIFFPSIHLQGRDSIVSYFRNFSVK